MEKKEEQKEKVAVTPATRVNVAKKSEDDKFTDKLIDKEIFTVDCVKNIFPQVEETELLGDEWGYLLLIDGEVVGSVLFAYWVEYGTGNRKFYWATNREIVQQIRKVKREWLAQKKKEGSEND